MSAAEVASVTKEKLRNATNAVILCNFKMEMDGIRNGLARRRDTCTGNRGFISRLQHLAALMPARKPESKQMLSNSAAASHHLQLPVHSLGKMSKG